MGPGLVYYRDRARRLRQPQQDSRATRSSTATSTRTSRKACGKCGAHDVFEEGTQLDGDGRPPMAVHCLTVRLPRALRFRARATADDRDGSDAAAELRLSVLHSRRCRTPSATPAARHHRRWWSTASRHRWRRGRERRDSSRFQQGDLSCRRQGDSRDNPEEIAAMNFHAQKQVATFRPDGTAANFTLNGLPPKPGAPFADPCRDDAGNAVGRPRLYKGAAIQLDLKLNKAAGTSRSRAF